MKPARFAYYAPTSVAETVDLLAQHGDGAKLLAGGQSLVPLMNMRLARPAVLVDIMRIASLAKTTAESGAIVVPAAVRQAAFMRRPSLTSESPLLHAALPWVGHYQTRARGTLCGSVAHADPSAEIPVAPTLTVQPRMPASPAGLKKTAEPSWQGAADPAPARAMAQVPCSNTPKPCAVAGLAAAVMTTALSASVLHSRCI